MTKDELLAMVHSAARVAFREVLDEREKNGPGRRAQARPRPLRLIPGGQSDRKPKRREPGGAA